MFTGCFISITFNSGGRYVAITDVKRNQLIKIFVDQRMNGNTGVAESAFVLYDNGVAIPEVTLSDPDTIVFRATIPGNLVLNMTRYYIIHKISVYSDPNDTKDVDLAVAKCDGDNRYISMSCATEGADIFSKTGTLSNVIKENEVG